jgi:peptidoglycan/LPS O-acetylase OafA/YrhL
MQEYKTSIFFKSYVLLPLIVVLFFIAQLLGFSSYKSISFLVATLMAVAWIIYLLFYGAKNGFLTKVFMFLGKISYSLYLIHIPLLLFFYSIIFYLFSFYSYPSPWTYFLPALLLIPLAFGFYLLFEKVSFTLIENHKKKLRQRSMVQGASLNAS